MRSIVITDWRSVYKAILKKCQNLLARIKMIKYKKPMALTIFLEANGFLL